MLQKVIAKSIFLLAVLATMIAMASLPLFIALRQPELCRPALRQPALRQPELGEGLIMQFLDDGSASVTNKENGHRIYLPPASEPKK